MAPLDLDALRQDLAKAIAFSRMAALQGEPQEYLTLLEQCALVINTIEAREVRDDTHSETA